jgi:hypothetical protein
LPHLIHFLLIEGGIDDLLKEGDSPSIHVCNVMV